MEKIFMSAGIITAIVLCVVGIAKLPFSSFKEKHPKGYKAVFTGLSLILWIGLSVLNELYILCGKLLSLDFAILICVVFASVFGGYNAYEGLGLKGLVKTIVDKVKEARCLAKNEKAKKYLNKIDDIDEAINILIERKNNQNSEV